MKPLPGEAGSARVEFTEKRIDFEDGPAGATYSNVRFEYRWRVKAGNNEIVASGEAYTRKSDAVRGFEDAAENIRIALLNYLSEKRQAALRSETVDPEEHGIIQE